MLYPLDGELKKTGIMTITELQQQYAVHPNVTAMNRLLKDVSVKHIFCGGLCASSASLFFSVLVRKETCPFVFILSDLEEAGYFYHDLTQVLGGERILFFPSSFVALSNTDRKMRQMRYFVPRFSVVCRKGRRGCVWLPIPMHWQRKSFPGKS